MQLDNYIHAIQEDLAATAGLGDEATARAAQRLSEALASTLHLRLLDLLGEAALEIGGQLGAGRVEVRLAGREPELVVVEDSSDSAHMASGEELSGRISLRLPESLKNSIEEAAAQEGISTNAWLIRAIARVLDSRSHHRRGRHRIQGYAQG
ncbi:MAG: type II toxin-antitoxin system HicB family antitoxin [Actinomycetota bacterium]|nr:type II toxin-antitoxin system HicB family antitoxin [Actinomycetota bacterium]